MWAWHPAEIARLLNVRSAPILLKKSKLAGLQKSREVIFVISDAARLSRFDANVAGRFLS
jgi:hypothetical protein